MSIPELVSAGSPDYGDADGASPSFGQETTAGNLLVAFVMSNGNYSDEAPEIACSDESWFQATSGGATYNWATIFYKEDCGSDETAPTFTDNDSSYVVAQLAEFAGCATSSAEDRLGAYFGFPSEVNCNAVDKAASDLIVGLAAWNGGTAVDASAQITGSGGTDLTTTTLGSNGSATSPQWIAAYAIGDSTLGSEVDTFTGTLSAYDNVPVNLVASFLAAS